MTGVSLTDKAARQIGEILRREPPGTMLRVSVEGGGCSGFQYKFDMEHDAGGRRRRHRARRRDRADRPDLARLSRRLRDRFRRRPDRRLVSDQQPARRRRPAAAARASRFEPQFGLMPAALASAPLISISFLMRASNSAGADDQRLDAGLSRAFPGWPESAAPSRFPRGACSTISRGVFAGASMPIQIGNSASR